LFSGCSQNTSKLVTDVTRLQKELNDLRGFQAEQTSQISSLQDRLREVSGRIEELEYSQQRRLGGDIDRLKSDLSNLKRRVPPPAVVPLAQLERDESMIPTLPPETGRLFDDALVALREAKFSESATLLNECLAQSYKAAWYPNVLFWLAVAHEGSGDFKSSLRYYYELSTDYSKHERAALALLRQGSILIRLGDTPSAKLSFQKLIAQYPKSAEASQAKGRLKDL